MVRLKFSVPKWALFPLKGWEGAEVAVPASYRSGEQSGADCDIHLGAFNLTFAGPSL